MFRISINFEGKLDPMFVFNMYMNPEVRKQWDDRVANMAFLPDGDTYIFYQQFIFNRPLSDRDFLARCHLAPIEGGFKMLFYSIKHRDFPEVREVERSKVYVSLYRFQMLNDVTTMHIIQQVDMHFSLLRVQQLVPLFMLNWAAKFREECLKRLQV